MITQTIPLTFGNLPNSLLWEQDGSCWKAIKDQQESKGWRWQPKNWTAFAKGEPNSEMVDYRP